MLDVRIERHGSLAVLQPLTDAGATWLDRNVDPGSLTWGTAVVAAPRYVPVIVAGMRDDGLTVEAA